MTAQIPSDCDPLLVGIAKEVCSKEGIDFDSLSVHQTRGLMYFWCSTCAKTHPLTDLTISKKKKVCTHCNDSIRLYTTSNKFGKIRRSIFFGCLSRLAAKVKN
jgi:hypothetical protein